MKIICVDGFNSYLGQNFYDKYKKRYKILKFKSDINNIKEIKNFINKHKISVFIRFAGLSRSNCEKYQKKCYRTNYEANKKFVNYIKTKRIKFIFLSTSHVYKSSNKKIDENFEKKPSNIYGKYKLKSENYIRKHLKDFLILRVFNIYGPNQPKGYFFSDIQEKIKNKQKIYINNSYRDFIHVNEVSRFLNFSIKKDLKGILNLGSGKSFSLQKIIKMISNKLKKPCIITKYNKTDKIVSSNNLIRKIGYKIKNEKNFNI
ncbi:SDR family oxidoreductase [Candidatus Pelagibacter sp.]|nr:SDR family oxidoreductase [Candidatus Pelagibacter sp.]